MARLHDWWDGTWQPVAGCKPMGPACLNCFAAKQAATLHQQAGATRRTVPQYAGITGRKKGRYFFNGRVTALEPGHDEWKWPLRWRGAEHPLLGPGQRSLIFVVGMADLFYDRPEHLIGRTLTTIAASEHIGLILTQRPDAMAKYFARLPASVVPRVATGTSRYNTDAAAVASSSRPAPCTRVQFRRTERRPVSRSASRSQSNCSCRQYV